MQEGHVATRKQWLELRKSGIGASDAAAIVGVSPYGSNIDLWRIKTKLAEPEDISNKPYVRYGTLAEIHLRELFALDFPDYRVDYEEFKMIRNPDYPFIFATPNGELTENNGRRGILEIKTTEIMQPSQWDKWNDQIPDNYYIQVLHQLLATGYEFAILKAQIKWRKNDEINLTTRHYRLERDLVLEDIEYLLKEEIKFWECVQDRREPNLLLPDI